MPSTMIATAQVLVPVGGPATQLCSTHPGRATLYVQADTTILIGDSSVSISTGFPNQTVQLDGYEGELWAFGPASGPPIKVYVKELF